MEKRSFTYERPTIVDHGTLAELTAMGIQVGGPNDLHGAHVPGHTCPTGGQSGQHCNGVGSEPHPTPGH